MNPLSERQLPPQDRSEQPEGNGSKSVQAVKTDVALLEKIEARLAGKLSWVDVARDLGVAASAVSKWSNGKYEGDVENLEALLSKWESDFDKRVDLRRDNVPTALTARIIRDIERCQRTKQLCVGTGRAGISKTVAQELFFVENSQTICLQAVEGHGDAAAMRRDVWEQRRIRRHKNERGSETDIIHRRMRGANTVVLVDDFHNCTTGGLRWLVGLHEICKMPMMLIGNPAGLEKIKRMLDEDQYTSRVGYCPTWTMTFKDAEELAGILLDQYAPNLKKTLLAEAIKACCKRGFGRKLKHQIVLTVDILDKGVKKNETTERMRERGATEDQIAFALAETQLLKREDE